MKKHKALNVEGPIFLFQLKVPILVSTLKCADVKFKEQL